MSKEILFILSDPIKYHSNGEVQESTDIMMVSPNMSQLKYAMPLKQDFMRAVMSMQKNENRLETDNTENDKDNKETFSISGEDVSNLMLVSSVDMTKSLDSFSKLILSGVAKVQNIQLTPNMVNTICIDDMERMLGEYVSNFLLPSLMKN